MGVQAGLLDIVGYRNIFNGFLVPRLALDGRVPNVSILDPSIDTNGVILFWIHLADLLP